MKARLPRCGAPLRTVVGVAAALMSVALAVPAGAAEPTRSTGVPTSSNGASSTHLALDRPPGRTAAATITVLQAPRVDALYFWALQVSFLDREGRTVGGAHLGLQWHPAHPSSTAVNFGGYGRDGHELPGSVSTLPSATGNANTRDLAWRAGIAYRLSMAKGRDGWVGRVTDLSTGRVTDVRTLYVDAAAVGHRMIFSEVFAACDAPKTSVRWSDLDATAALARFQPYDQGGCTNTDLRADGDSILHLNAVRRTLRSGSRLVHRTPPAGEHGSWQTTGA